MSLRFASEPDERKPGIGKTEDLLAFAAAVGVTLMARNALQAGWRATLDRDPPKNPASPAADWNDALLWGAVSAVVCMDGLNWTPCFSGPTLKKAR